MPRIRITDSLPKAQYGQSIVCPDGYTWDENAQQCVLKSQLHPEWYDEGVDPENDLMAAKPKTPYSVPTGPVATMQGPMINNISQQPDATNPWSSVNPNINGKTPAIPTNPNASKEIAVDYNQMAKGTPTSVYNEDIIDPTSYLKQERRKLRRQDQWDNFKEGITNPAKKITQAANWLNNNPTSQKILNTADDIYKGAMAIAPPIQYITDLKTQRRFDEQSDKDSVSDNLYNARPASMTGNRGDYDINTGIFRPDEIGFKSKGQYTNAFSYPVSGSAAYGGMINNNSMEKVRIRITGGTEKMATGGQPMTYSGQLGYGLNLGQKRIYTDMPPDKTETVNNTLKAVPREQANIEAEKGETVYGDIDGDGAMEHMLIGGKKHTEGGTPLNVPEGSFIFSDTKDLIIKDKKILEKFNMPSNKKGYTPAEIAKKYDTNKYKAVMEDVNADPIKKSTAQIMIKTFQKKLAELSLIQEEMKGFPQGIPEIAKKAMPELQTKEDQQKQPGVSDNLQFDQPQGSQEEMVEDEEQQMQPQMEYGGMIPKYLFAGEVDDDLEYYTNDSLGDSGPDDPNAVNQTRTSKQRPSLNDPEFIIFKKLMEKFNYSKRDPKKYKAGTGNYYINALTPVEAREFARLATKFGFSRAAEGAVGTGDAPTWNADGYRITQGATPGYSMTRPDGTKFGFFGGFTPQLFEKRLVEDVYGVEASNKMTDVERRKAFLKQLGIEDSKLPTDAQLAKPKTLYQNKNFFNNIFHPAFTKTFAKEGFRPEMGDDMLIGAEYFDSYQTKPDETVIGFKCAGRDPETGEANITSRTYANSALRTADNAYATKSLAYLQCPEQPAEPEKTPEPGKLKDPCPPGYYRDVNGVCVKTPFDFMTPDKVNMLAAALATPKKYLPSVQKLPFEPGDVVFKDWRAKAAERQGLINRMADQLNTYSPGTSVASNLSFLAGQQAEGLIKDIDDVDSYNVQTANAFTDRERQRKDQNNIINLAKAEELYKGNVIANQQYDNAKRQYINNMAKSYGQAWKNRMQLGLLNSVNPMFNIDPYRGNSYFKNGYDANDLTGMIGGLGTNSNVTLQSLMDYRLKAGYTLAEARAYAIKVLEEQQKNTGVTGKTPKQQALLQARSLLGLYGGLGSNFNADEESQTI
jgi:hypothetical protein